MANEQNLNPFTSEQNREEASKNGRKGGVASGVARRRKRDLKKIFLDILDMPIKEGEIDKIKSLAELKGANITVEQAMCYAQIKKAMNGDFTAFKAIVTIAELMQKEEAQTQQDNSFIQALEGKAAEVWSNEE